jgi:hypothetical protein
VVPEARFVLKMDRDILDYSLEPFFIFQDLPTALDIVLCRTQQVEGIYKVRVRSCVREMLHFLMVFFQG